MKKILSVLLCITAFTTSVGFHVSAASEGIYLPSGAGAYLDTEYRDELLDEKWLTVSEDDGDEVLHINGASSIRGSRAVMSGLRDFIIDADIKQLSNTGATSGVFSIGLRSAGTTSTQYRLVYASALNVKGTVVNDRLAIVRSNGSDNCNDWSVCKISEKPTGLLKSGKTPWFHLRGCITDNGIEMSVSDENDKLIDRLSCTMLEANLNIVGMPSVEEGGVMLSTHSVTAVVKNIKVTPIKKYSSLELVLPYRKMYAGQLAEPSVTEGNEPIYNGCAYIPETKDGKLSFDRAGKYKVRLRASDILTGETVEAEKSVEVLDKIAYERIEADMESASMLLGSDTGCTVYGVSKDGERYPVDARCEGSGVRLEDGRLFADVSGKQRVKFTYESLSTETDITVSRYKDIRLVPCRDTVKMWDMVYCHAVCADEKGEYTELIPSGDIISEDGAFVFDGGRLKATLTGAHTLNAVVDDVTVSADVTVLPKDEGLVLEENFDSGDTQSEYLRVPPQMLADCDGGKAILIENYTTPFFGGEDWTDYRVSFRLKIDNAALEPEQYGGTFEFLARRKIPSDGMFGGDKGIPFIYRTSHNIHAPHMRISTVTGADMSIEDGKWHDAEVEVNGSQMIFRIDNQTLTMSGNFPQQGYFSFRASNVRAYVDDVKAVRIKNKAPQSGAALKKLIPNKDTVTISVHDAWSIASLFTLKGVYSDGSSKYMHFLNDMTWSVAEGTDVISVSRNRGIKGIKAGTAVLLGKCGSSEIRIKVNVVDDGVCEEEYARRTTRQRRETFFYSVQCKYNDGVRKGVGGLDRLGVYYGEMLIHPRIRDYSEILDWHSLQAEYEDKVVGRGNDGGDFILLQMINIYNKLHGRINASEESFEGMREYLDNVVWPEPSDWMSENHKGVYYAAAVLVGETFPDDIMHGGITGRELCDKYTGYLKDWANLRLRRGFLEYDSAHYYSVDIFTMDHLYDVTKNPELKKLAADMLTYLYGDILCDSLEDSHTGAHSRVYAGLAYTTKFRMLEIMFDKSTVVFDELGPENAVQISNVMAGEYEPPQVIYDIAFEKDKRFANKERRSLYAIPDDPAIDDTMEKYTYTTPTYSMGCVVHVDDLTKYWSDVGNYQPVTATYPEGTRRNIIQGQQEMPWSLHMAGSSETMIYEGHPGRYGPGTATHAHAYFVGDLHCNCYQYFQDENVSIGMHKITIPGEVKFTHFWLPRSVFENIREEAGWIFIDHKGTFAAIRPLKDGNTDGVMYEWGNPSQMYNGTYPLNKFEVKTVSKDTAFAVEVYEEAEYGKSFDDFCRDIIENTKIDYSVGSDYYIEYTSLKGKRLKIDYNNNLRYIDGKLTDTHEYKLQDSPYMDAAWDTGKITIRCGENSYEINAFDRELDTQKAASVLESLRSFEKEYKICSKSRMRSFLDTRVSGICELAKGMSGYRKTSLYDMVMKRFKDISAELEKSGSSELGAVISQLEQVSKEAGNE